MRYKAIVAYDGHGYAGFQKQINAEGIQSVIEKALSKIAKEPVAITAAGRTDAGVHALGQVFHFDGPDNIRPHGWYNALNTLLPKDIRIKSVEPVPDDFHARFSAVGKVYEYVITQERDNPFNEHYKTFVWRPLDLEKMREGTRILEGEHDFTSFSSAQIDPRKPRTKRIDAIAITKEGPDIKIRYEGNGFLRYQVRMMSAALIALGEGKISLADLQQILEAKHKHACRFNAPAKGLYLMEVRYNPDALRMPPSLKEKTGKTDQPKS